MSHPHLDLVLDRGRTSLHERLTRLRNRRFQVAQCAAAAGIAWFIAHDVFGHPRAFFAPVAAIVCLGTSYGQRLRRVGEVAVGVAIGIFLGDMLTLLIGSGPWQIALIVLLAMTLALLLDGGVLFVNQAAIQAVVVSTLLSQPNLAFTRWTDALIGGAVALVAATLVPRAALRKPREQAADVVREIVHLLRAASESLQDGQVDRALAVLSEARHTDRYVRELQEAADEGLDIVASSPFRLRHRPGVRMMAELVEPLDYALRNTRVLVRRVAVAAYRREPVPAGYPAMIADLAACADLVADELAGGRMAVAARDDLIALGQASSGMQRGEGLSAEVILAQVRSIIADLLAVSGIDPLAATDAIPPLHQT